MEKLLLINIFIDYILNTANTNASSSTQEAIVLFIEKNISALAIAITALLGAIWLVYSQSMIEEVKKRSDGHITLILDALENLVYNISWRLSNFESNYVKCQEISCTEYKVEGFNIKDKGLFPLTIEDVFIALNITKSDHGSSRSIYPNGSSQTIEKRHGDIWHFICQVEQQKQPIDKFIVILAAVGYGKTSLLKHITLNYAKKTKLIRQNKLKNKVPVLIYLRQTTKFFTERGWVTLPDLIINFHIPNLRDGNRLKPVSGWAEKLLLEGKFVIMFDGFDEIPKPMRIEIATWINQQIKKYYKSTFIMTSRHEGYADYKAACSPDEYINELFLEQFNKEQQISFLNKWYFTQEKLAWFKRKKRREIRLIAQEKVKNLVQQIEQNSTLSDLAGNPLLLSMIATLYNLSSSGEIPYKKAELYQNILNLQLEDRPKSKGINIPFSGINSQKLLQKLALTLVVNDLIAFQDKQVENGLQRYLDKIKNYEEDYLKEKTTARRFLEQIMEFSQLLLLTKTRPNYKVYEFAHISFQEYLAALEIVNSGKEKLLFRHTDDGQWREIILFYAAQQTSRKKIQDLISQLYKKRTRASILLAIDCLDVTSVRFNRSVRFKLLKTITPQLTLLSVNALEKALKNGEWEKANHETCQLLMKPQNQSLSEFRHKIYQHNEEDINFIDYLWKKYSQNKFGFDLQKNVYLEVVGRKKTAPSQKAILDLSEKLGWRVNGRWLKYEDIRFEFHNSSDIKSMPDGYLPILLQEGERYGDINWANVIDQIKDLVTIYGF